MDRFINYNRDESLPLLITLGVPVGPFIFGFVTYRVGYHWIYWILAMVSFRAEEQIQDELAAVDLWIGQLMDRFINYNRDERSPWVSQLGLSFSASSPTALATTGSTGS
jgi:hypothetical protein